MCVWLWWWGAERQRKGGDDKKSEILSQTLIKAPIGALEQLLLLVPHRLYGFFLFIWKPNRCYEGAAVLSNQKFGFREEEEMKLSHYL